jgi:hypothetical protein
MGDKIFVVVHLPFIGVTAAGLGYGIAEVRATRGARLPPEVAADPDRVADRVTSLVVDALTSTSDAPHDEIVLSGLGDPGPVLRRLAARQIALKVSTDDTLPYLGRLSQAGMWTESSDASPLLLDASPESSLGFSLDAAAEGETVERSGPGAERLVEERGSAQRWAPGDFIRLIPEFETFPVDKVVEVRLAAPARLSVVEQTGTATEKIAAPESRLLASPGGGRFEVRCALDTNMEPELSITNLATGEREDLPVSIGP